MRKLVAYELLSLDGVAENPLGSLDGGFITDWDEVMDENLRRVIADQDAVLLGRRTYDDWLAFWPTRDDYHFARFINGVQKFVVTSTQPKPWTNTTVISGDLVLSIEDLKRQPGGDIGVHGSISLTQALLEQNLIDELRLVIAPDVRLHGRRLFERGAPTRLELSRSVTSPTGYLLLDFAVAN